MTGRKLLPIWILLAIGWAALSCNLPGYVSATLNRDPPQEFWWTPTPIPIFTFVPGVGDQSPTLTPVPALPVVSSGQTLPAAEPDASVPILYYAQAGDTLPAVAVRFGVLPEEITSPNPIPETALINPNQLLIIPRRLGGLTPSDRLLPDSEVVFSPSALDFDIEAYVRAAGGYLSSYQEYLASTGNTSGAKIIERVALENSINPRLLLALLEYQSNWVFGQPQNLAQTDYPMGYVALSRKGLFRQLVWAVNQISTGYYGWREGLLTEVEFSDGVRARLAPELNAGTAALQYYFSKVYDPPAWQNAIHPETGLAARHESMFDNPWVRAISVEPLYPPDLQQPPLILPFLPGQLWGFTGGPHGAWERHGARAALDFAPGSLEPGCVRSDNVAVAAASGQVVRTSNGVIVLDLDGDGHEQTGWALLYLHISNNGNRPLAPLGTWVNVGDPLGYPSCEGGASTGTHIHFARKYNGEWIPADGPLPFIMDGWVAHAGSQPYEGTLTRDGQTVRANPLGTFETRIIRQKDDP